MKKFVINIGRQLGSGGRLIGQNLSEQLNITFYDKELLNIASKESGLGAEFFEKADEKRRFSFLGGLFGLRSNVLGNDSSQNYLCGESLFQIQSDVIRHIADENSAIFVGRCADYILRDHPRTLNIFVTSKLEDRIPRVCNYFDIDEKQARELIIHTDKRRADYYNYYSNKIWGSAMSYDICIDSSQLGINQTADYIALFVKRKFKL